ncbi:glycosyltransferase family 1 protein [Corallococcus sp. H22C18031201]|nr:glycosyltransferase [Citreicoccus inhibens]RJS23126.1 glycosyltransferase family 1 protein [Corallococcus sp. H22C18031201]
MPDTRPIRLVQFTKSFWLGGTEVQVVELLRGLPRHYPVQVAVLEKDGPLLEGVRALGIEPVAFPLGPSARHPVTLRRVVAAASWLRRMKVELVHAQDLYSALIAVPAARLAGCKVVVSRLDLGHWHTSLQARVLRWLTAHAHHVVANAEAIRSQLLAKEGLPPERVSVIRNGLDVAAFDARAREGLFLDVPDIGDAPLVVHVANMSHPVKRQEDLIAAVARARRRVPTLQAFLVGDGARRPELESFASAQGVADAVHFLSWRADVPALYARATVGVNCSAAEGLSNAVMEGMAAGLPMVVTDVGGNPELVANGRRGRVVPARAPDALASALVELVGAPDTAKAMGRAARSFVVSELGLGRMVAEHDALYRRLVHGPLTPARDAGPVPHP